MADNSDDFLGEGGECNEEVHGASPAESMSAQGKDEIAANRKREVRAFHLELKRLPRPPQTARTSKPLPMSIEVVTPKPVARKAVARKANTPKRKRLQLTKRYPHANVLFYYTRIKGYKYIKEERTNYFLVEWMENDKYPDSWIPEGNFPSNCDAVTDELAQWIKRSKPHSIPISTKKEKKPTTRNRKNNTNRETGNSRQATPPDELRLPDFSTVQLLKTLYCPTTKYTHSNSLPILPDTEDDPESSPESASAGSLLMSTAQKFAAASKLWNPLFPSLQVSPDLEYICRGDWRKMDDRTKQQIGECGQTRNKHQFCY